MTKAIRSSCGVFEDGYQEADGIADEIAQAIVTQGLRPRDFAVFCRMNALTRSLEHALRNRGIPYQIVNGLEFYQRKEIKDLLAYLHLINNPSHDVALTRIINTPTRGIGAKTIERLRRFADTHRIPMLEAARRGRRDPPLAKRSATMVAKFVSIYDRLCDQSDRAAGGFVAVPGRGNRVRSVPGQDSGGPTRRAIRWPTSTN